ncbi:M28 family peptidase [Candidatus Bipolaricaulota bacterium]
MKEQRASSRLVGVLSWVVLLLAVAAGVAPHIPPASPSNSNDADFSVARVIEHIETIAVEPRPIGTPASQRARDYISDQLRSLGLEPEFQTTYERNYFSPLGETIEVVNILARIPGSSPTAAVALLGHYDTVPSTLGANDDASAVAILLESARAILAGDPLRNDLILIFTDGEEPAPRFGSSAFVNSHPWFADIGFVINLEAIGSGGSSIVVGMNGPTGWMIDQYARAVPYPTAFSFVTATVELIGGSNTDFATFRDAGVFGVDLAYMTGSPIYHTMADSPERVSARSVYQQGANTLALVRHIGSLDLSSVQEGSESVFFTVGRFIVVRYLESWALPIILVAGFMLIVAAWRERGWLRILRSFGATLAALLLSMAASAGLWILIGSWRSTMGIFESYVYLAGFVLLTAGIGTAMVWVTRRRIGTGPDAIGVVLVWWLLGLLTTLTMPGLSALFTWPALIGGLLLMLRLPQSAKIPRRHARWTLVCLTTMVVLIPAIDFFYQFAQPRPGNLDSQILAAIAIPVMLIALVVELLRVFRVRTSRLRIIDRPGVGCR